MDVITLLVAVLVNALLMLLALAVSVGVRARGGLQAWQLMLLGQAAGFGLLITATRALPLLMATLGVMALSGSASAMTLAVGRFLALPVSRRVLWAPPLALGVVHVFLFPDLKQTTGVTNLTIGLQIGWASWLLLAGVGRVRWRWLCGTAALANAVLTFARGTLVLGWPEIYPRFLVPHPLNIAHLMLLNASLVLGTMGFLLAHRDAAEQALVRLASLDNLTGLLNRREWMQRAGRALGAADAGAVLLMLDLDHFKRVNDERGHPVGDEVLKLTGEVLRGELRASDLVGRYGGEEFCLLLRQCDPEAFGRLDSRLHQALRRRCEASLGFPVDFSAGAVRVVPGESLSAAIQRADDQLYRAKHAGRGRTCCAAGVL
ncbi:MAG: GGDEF domain-containing protein [Burkholderiales bacterium]|nr:MAG: GGDEF domain-containing protein [Burkholderiales bacterium]